MLSSGTPRSIVTLVMIVSKWDADSEGDKEVVSEITANLCEIERDIALT